VCPRSDKFIGAPKYLVLVFEVANTPTGNPKLLRPLCRHARSLVAMNSAPLDSLVNCGPGGLEITLGLSD
jgi:hypothetical protein